MTADSEIKFMLDSLDESEQYFRATPQGPAAGALIRPTPINKPRAAVTRLTDPARDQHFATVCFNGMLNPVIPYAIRGALWYQGESICWGTRPQFIRTGAKDDDSRLAVAVGRRRFSVLSGATAGAAEYQQQSASAKNRCRTFARPNGHDRGD